MQELEKVKEWAFQTDKYTNLEAGFILITITFL